MISWMRLWLGEDSPAGTRRWGQIHVWKMPLFFSFRFCLVSLRVFFPGRNRPGCHQWLISIRRFHLQTTSQTLQGSAVLHPPTGAVYRGDVDPRWEIHHVQTCEKRSINHSCLCQTSFQTELGQTLDLMTAPPGQIDLNRFTMERYCNYFVNITLTELWNLIYLSYLLGIKPLWNTKLLFTLSTSRWQLLCTLWVSQTCELLKFLRHINISRTVEKS